MIVIADICTTCSQKRAHCSTCAHVDALSCSCRGKALDRALAATWKVLQDESTGLSANIEQKVRLLVILTMQRPAFQNFAPFS